MDEHKMRQVAAVLSAWNPLGTRASEVDDLDGYRTEAIDIISWITMSGKTKAPGKIVMEVLNQAFGLDLKRAECDLPAKKIVAIVFGHQ